MKKILLILSILFSLMLSSVALSDNSTRDTYVEPQITSGMASLAVLSGTTTAVTTNSAQFMVQVMRDTYGLINVYNFAASGVEADNKGVKVTVSRQALGRTNRSTFMPGTAATFYNLSGRTNLFGTRVFTAATNTIATNINSSVFYLPSSFENGSGSTLQRFVFKAGKYYWIRLGNISATNKQNYDMNLYLWPK